ncbi:MAG: UDP-N-acetylmuramate--L-alanine ligase, partial [Gammaproteobacteria bacterium]
QRGAIKIGKGQVVLIDDYAHHPKELDVTIDAVKNAWPEKRLVVLFQPHRYTRTRDLLDDFSMVLDSVDRLLITEVYAAGEAPISGADGRSLCRAIRARGANQPVLIESLEEAENVLANVLDDDDVLLTLGAGDIGAFSARLAQRYGVAA